MRRHLQATVALMEILPPKFRTGHLAENARSLVARAEQFEKIDELTTLSEEGAVE